LEGLVVTSKISITDALILENPLIAIVMPRESIAKLSIYNKNNDLNKGNEMEIQ